MQKGQILGDNREWWLPGAEGREEWETLLNGNSISLQGGEEVFELDRGGDSTKYHFMVPFNMVILGCDNFASTYFFTTQKLYHFLRSQSLGILEQGSDTI